MVSNDDITEVTSRLVAKQAAKSLRVDWASKGILQTFRPGPQCFARGDHARRGAWCCKGKLVVQKRRVEQMSMSDPIADMLTRIRNGHAVGSVSVSMPSSGIKQAVARVLQEEGFIDGCTVAEENGKKTLTVALRYFEGVPVINQLQRVSRPGKRVYCHSSDIPAVNNGLGVVVVSTSKGIMTGREAKTSGTGGELICVVS